MEPWTFTTTLDTVTGEDVWFLNMTAPASQHCSAPHPLWLPGMGLPRNVVLAAPDHGVGNAPAAGALPDLFSA